MEPGLHFLSSGRKTSYHITMKNFHLKKQKLKPHRVAFFLLKMLQLLSSVMTIFI